MVTKAVSVTRSSYRQALLEVIPEIRRVWPGGAASSQQATIMIQQDNASPHLSNDDPEVTAAMAEGGYHMELTFQPAKSPDLNALDLGMFRSMQSLQQQQNCRRIEDLIQAVMDAWDSSQGETLEKVWLSLARHMEAIMKAGGGNEFSTPHRSQEEKALLQATADLKQLPCSEEAVETALAAARELIAAGTQH
jgi:hypothetical protein